MVQTPYQTVIGLEIHIQLSTQSKIFAPEKFSFGQKPNHQVSLVSMAHPGSLPRINEAAIQSAIKLGLALDCSIQSPTYFDRKNYFYPDLPKGYQISQDAKPICGPGKVQFPDNQGNIKEIRIHHIHLEEDAGKSIHELSPHYSMVDLNRAGAGLLELVTQPDLESPEDAAALLMEMRRIVRYLGISDGNMQEGNLRCDANVSLKPWEQKELGTRVEIKNINSFSFLTKALEFEIKRQTEYLQEGKKIIQETRTFNPSNGRTSSMRDKESADDYRYFPEPDLLPIKISPENLDKVKRVLPKLSSKRYQDYRKNQIAHNEALTLIEDQKLADYFDQLSAITGNFKEALNWILGPVKAHLNEENISIAEFPLEVHKLAELLSMILEGKITRHLAREKAFTLMLASPNEGIKEIAKEHDLIQENNEDELEELILKILKENPNETERFKSGQKKLQGFFVGKIMKASKGKANPKKVNEVLRRLIAKF
ncbi:MAG: Asp-tRNA(Asn)/Glu-tRNA(Gln) amidotransferase subunit GatB [Bacteroidia bacterium]|nr:Asp-tRNA(Asn)/Glu-tRNA(Gln) amidotransferase subunit GatB [Bacteroidia bacterium]